MVAITNTNVYNLKEAVIACRNAMRTSPAEQTEEEFEASLKRAMTLAKAGGGSGHSNFRKGITVSFDIKYPIYWTKELQRYKFVEIITSSSTMHRLTVMNIDECCNKYVTEPVKEELKKLIEVYNNDKTYENFMRCVSNCPCGLELFMHVTTNYEQLATIYRQRKNHKLKEDWGAFCSWIESLPYAAELIARQA